MGNTMGDAKCKGEEGKKRLIELREEFEDTDSVDIRSFVSGIHDVIEGAYTDLTEDEQDFIIKTTDYLMLNVNSAHKYGYSGDLEKHREAAKNKLEVIRDWALGKKSIVDVVIRNQAIPFTSAARIVGERGFYY